MKARSFIVSRLFFAVLVLSFIVPTGQPAAASTDTLPLPQLKAVLLVGPIDGDDGPWTMKEVANMEKAASVLEANGVAVHRLYPGSATLEEVDQAAQGAHFLLYRGHGIYDGNLPNPVVGGFYLSGGYYSPERMRTNLRLAPNAIVMLYACFTAGSSSAVGDDYDIGVAEAARRIVQYASPFFENGAAGYYANWFGDAFERFLTHLFAGHTLGQAYENYFDFNAATVYRTTYPANTALDMWIDKDHWDYWKYNNAFIGQSSRTLRNLFLPPALSVLPQQVTFIYNVTDGFLSDSFSFSLENIGGGPALDWQISSTISWLQVYPLAGSTPQSISLTAVAPPQPAPGVLDGALSFTIISSQSLQGSQQTIPVRLVIYDSSTQKLFLPVITNR